jgi:hypothetical protein
MEGENEFSYDDFWKEKERTEEKKIQKEVEALPKGNPRKGVKGRYIKPKHYVSRRSSIRAMRTFVYTDKKVE